MLADLIDKLVTCMPFAFRLGLIVSHQLSFWAGSLIVRPQVVVPTLTR